MSMLEGYELTDPLPVGAPPTNAETTYTRYHLSSVKSVEGNAYDLLVHPNGLCIVRLSPSHPLCQGDKDAKLDVQLGSAVSEAVYRKGRGPRLQADSLLCRVRDPETGQEHALHAAVQGSLVDVSLHLLNNTLSRR
ncbi:hypothetical protein ACKKBG_A30195 [Auxenochlorella protothecoides x Auxenochlorella symbiontica]